MGSLGVPALPGPPPRKPRRRAAHGHRAGQTQAPPRALQTFRACEGGARSPRQRQRLQREWKMAKMELLVILLFVLSWAPYSAVALTAFAG